MNHIKRTIALLVAITMTLTFSPIGIFADESEHVHSWSDWFVIQEPSCGEPGVQEHQCTDCYETVQQSIPATGDHDWSDWEVTKKSTVFKKGKKERFCYECGRSQSRAIARVKAFARFKKKAYKLKIGRTLSLKYRLKYGRGDKVKKWKTSNKRIATVTSTGKIKAKRSGKVKITAKLKSGKVASCKVRVTAPKKKARSKAKKRSGGGTVYWVPNGEVYHSTPNCSTLSRSRTIKSGPLSQCPKSRPCKRCH